MESWVSADIPNPDIALPNCLLFCHDCNHHGGGGGIVVYINSHLTTSVVHVYVKLNFFLLSIKLIIAHFHLALTTNLHVLLTTKIIYLMNSNPSILSIFSNLILLGDFV